MAINKADARHRIKRTNLTGVRPTVPAPPANPNDFTDGTWLNTDIRPGEFFYNIPDKRLWIGTNSEPTEIPTFDKIFLLPRLSTGEISLVTGVNGMLVYNTSTNKFMGYENGSWVNLI